MKIDRLLDKNDRLICVTGKIASGKNYICSLLEQKGWHSIDADKLVHSAIENQKQKILDEFSGAAAEKNITLLTADGHIDRRQLGSLLFSRPDLLQKQEQIVYPEITSIVKEYLAQNSDQKIILNATLLFKTPDLLNMCSKILYVTTFPPNRYLRSKKRDNFTRAQVRSRLKAQRHLYKRYKQSGRKIKIIFN